MALMRGQGSCAHHFPLYTLNGVCYNTYEVFVWPNNEEVLP